MSCVKGNRTLKKLTTAEYLIYRIYIKRPDTVPEILWDGIKYSIILWNFQDYIPIMNVFTQKFPWWMIWWIAPESSWMVKLQLISSRKIYKFTTITMKIFLLFVMLPSIQCYWFTLEDAIENLQWQRWDFSNVRKDFDKLYDSECDEINTK